MEKNRILSKKISGLFQLLYEYTEISLNFKLFLEKTEFSLKIYAFFINLFNFYKINSFFEHFFILRMKYFFKRRDMCYNEFG